MPRVKEYTLVIPMASTVPDDMRERAITQYRATLDRPFRGPRGGTYVPFGPITEDSTDAGPGAWDRNMVWYRMRRMGKYVRPKR